MASVESQPDSKSGHKSHDMGLHAEQLSGRAQQVFFNAAEEGKLHLSVVVRSGF